MEKQKFIVKLNCKQKEVAISPTFIGAFFEDINYGADGGLYAELIQNRSFEFENYLYGWEIIGEDRGKINVARGNKNPIHMNNPNYLHLSVEETDQNVGIRNLGFGGIALLDQEEYEFSIFLRNKDYEGDMRIVLEGISGQRYAEHRISSECMNENWKKHEITLTSNNTDSNARLSIILGGLGSLDIDMVSLFPHNTWKKRRNGLRHDMVKMLKDMKPQFLRFPGGCIVEGNKLANAYKWKDTIGPIEHRKMDKNRWEEWVDYPYNQSYGLGFYEYFLLAKDIGATPLPIINCGMSCQYQSGEVADDIEPYIQDALDLIEFANGDASTKWGSKRIEAGHEEPFNLVYLGIGNEQWVDYSKPISKQYFTIYEIFRNRIKEKYPQIQLISSAGPSAYGEEYDAAWEIIANKTEEYIKENKVYTEIVDEHYYMSPQWFLENNNRYDSYKRYNDGKSCKVFAGEYACHTHRESGKEGENNLYSALCEASFMIGLERNSDLVIMTAYAPLFAKINNWQWKPNLIWFDNTSVYPTPNYYVQKMFGNNMGTHTLKTDIESKTRLAKHKRFPIYSIGSIDEDKGEIIVKLVNMDESYHDIQIQLDGLDNLKSEAKGTCISSERKSDTKVSESTFTLNDVSKEFNYEIPAQSFVILRFYT